MKKSTLNFIIDSVMFLCMLATVSIGFLIKYTLIPGKDRWVKYGGNVELYFLKLDRHQWGTIHLITGLVLVGLLIAHILLHWKMIASIYDRFVISKSIKTAAAIAVACITILLLVAPFFVTPEVSEIKKGKGRQQTTFTEHQKKGNEMVTMQEKNKHSAKTGEKKHKKSSSSLDVKGFMTLAEVATKYNVPTEYLKTKLHFPNSVSDDQKLGKLKKTYTFTMDDVKKAIEEYNKK
jgi:hypothetical protein